MLTQEELETLLLIEEDRRNEKAIHNDTHSNTSTSIVLSDKSK